MNSSEKNMRALERAYLALGPTAIGLRPQHSGTSVSITVDNIGRTAAFIEKVYGEFSPTLPRGDIPRYEQGEWKLCSFGVKAGTTVPKLPVEFMNNLTDPHFFWGFVEFQDIFREKHIVRFCTRIWRADGKFDSAGTPAWNDWD
jgi:hypothetical protein